MLSRYIGLLNTRIKIITAFLTFNSFKWCNVSWLWHFFHDTTFFLGKSFNLVKNHFDNILKNEIQKGIPSLTSSYNLSISFSFPIAFVRLDNLLVHCNSVVIKIKFIIQKDDICFPWETLWGIIWIFKWSKSVHKETF